MSHVLHYISCKYSALRHNIFCNIKGNDIQIGFGKLRATSSGYFLSIQSSSPPTYSNPSLSQNRLVNNAKNLYSKIKDLELHMKQYIAKSTQEMHDCMLAARQGTQWRLSAGNELWPAPFKNISPSAQPFFSPSATNIIPLIKVLLHFDLLPPP